MKLLNLIGEIFAPLCQVIDDVHTSDEERGKIKLALEQLQNNLSTQLLEYQAKLDAARAKVLTAEISSDSWLQKSWRPIVILWFSSLIGAHWLGFTPANLSEATVIELLAIVKVAIGGYVLGRSGEKMVKGVASIIRNPKGDQVA